MDYLLNMRIKQIEVSDIQRTLELHHLHKVPICNLKYSKLT